MMLPDAKITIVLIAGLLLLNACNDDDSPTPRTNANLLTPGEDVPGELPPATDRLVSLEQLARVRAGELVPGTAYIDPNIENPFAGDPEAIAAGRRHFAAFNCNGCHAPLGGGGMGPPLSDGTWIYGGEPAQIYLSVMHGRPAGMPAFSSMLTEKIVWELAAYIDTLDEIDDYANRDGFSENTAGFRQEQGEPPHEVVPPEDR